MSKRAFIIGIIAALFIATFGYVNDWLLDLERFNSGHLLPIIVVGPMLVFCFTLNILFNNVFPSIALKGSELAVIFFLATSACSVTGRNMMEHLPHIMVIPHHWYQVTPGWRSKQLLDYFPKNSMVDPTYSNDVVSGFINGEGKPEDLKLPFMERSITRIKRVPWGAWLPPIKLWVPIALLSAICYACLALILHKQWADNEHLAYPLADFISSFLTPGKSGPIPDIFRNRLFWLGLGVVLLIRLNNGLCFWFPEYLIPIKLTHNFVPFAKIFPSITRVPWGMGLFRLEVFPLVIAFAFMLSTEISLTMGLSQLLWVLFAAPFVAIGVDFNTNYSGIGWSGWQRACSYIAFALILVYTGRHYYWSVIKRTFTDWDTNTPDKNTLWATRILCVAIIAWVAAAVCFVNIPLPFAIITLFLGLLSGIVVSRISTETGLFFIHTRWQPFALMLALFGSTFMNPTVIIATIMLCFVLSIDQSQCYLPYLANALKVCDNLKLPKTKLTAISYATCAVGLITALFVAIVFTYDRGTPKQCAWSWRETSKICFIATEPEVLQLKSVGMLDTAENTPWYAKLGTIKPKPNFIWAVILGFAGVWLFSFLRLRYPWWPLHPIIFLVWMTWPMYVLSGSIFLGWVAKKITIRVGGFSLVQKFKPMMFGIIGGEILGAIVFMAVGAIYFMLTDKPPIAYRYFPR